MNQLMKSLRGRYKVSAETPRRGLFVSDAAGRSALDQAAGVPPRPRREADAALAAGPANPPAEHAAGPDVGLALPGQLAARGACDLGGNADGEHPGRNVRDDVRVRCDDRLASDPAARVDDGAEADLPPVLDDDPRKAVLEAFEDGVADVVGHEHRAHRR